MLNQTTTIIGTIGLCVLGIAIAEYSRDEWQDNAADPIMVAPTRLSASIIRAPGRITGETEQIEIRSRVVETVQQIHVKEGQRVKRGQLLITLENEIRKQECRLAESTL
ncbi:MAG: biotin/lipoyl-binding protein, partial [Planctomycetota bacterium]